MIKQRTNLNGIKIDTNMIVNGSNAVYHNQAIYNITSGKSILYKFSNVTFEYLDTVVNSKLIIPVVGSGTFEIKVYKNNSSYNPTNVNYGSRPTYNTSKNIYQEIFTISKSGGVEDTKIVEIDLSDQFKEWKNEQSNNMSLTIVFTLTKPLKLYTPVHTGFKNNVLLSLTEIQDYVFSPSYNYLLDEVSGAGTSFVNTKTGRLTYLYDVFQTSSKKIPIKFSVNTSVRPSNFTMRNSLVGNWRTNFDYGFKVESNKITIATPEGKVLEYYKISKEQSMDYGLKIGSVSFCYFNFKDRSYIIEAGIVSGRIRYIWQVQKNMTIEFTANNRILNIIKDYINIITFNYNTSDQLTSITSNDGYRVTLSYLNGRIQYVNFVNENIRLYLTYFNTGIYKLFIQKIISEETYSGTIESYENLSTISYSLSDYRITEIMNELTGEITNFTYNNEKVTDIINKVNSGSTINTSSFRKITYQGKYTKVLDHKNFEEHLIHDYYGMILHIIDGEGNTSSTRNISVGIGDNQRKAIRNTVKIPLIENNLLDNLLIGQDFESGGLDNFECVSCNQNDGIIIGSVEMPYNIVLGNRRFKFSTANGIVKSLRRRIDYNGTSNEQFTLSFWAKSNFDEKSNLRAKVLLMKSNKIIQTVESSADKELDNWQLLSFSFITEKSYDSITLIIEYTGENQCLVDSISLYRNKHTSTYEYDDYGIMINQENNGANTGYKIKDGQILETNNYSGMNYKYEYNNLDKPIRIIDSRKTITEFGYDSKSNNIKVLTKSNNKTIETSKEYDSKNRLITQSNELGNKTKFTYDNKERIKTITDAVNLITTNSYDELNNLISILKYSDTTSIAASFQYYSDTMLKKIITENGTNYEFIYDDLKRVIKIKLNNKILVANEYGLSKNGISLDILTKQTVGQDIYTFNYNSKYRLESVKTNNLETKYFYDKQNKINKKVMGNKIDYYDYDSNGNLLRKTNESGESINFDYDNLSQLQKMLIDINGFKRSYDFEYINEYNEYNEDSARRRLIRAFNNDIIDYNESNTGMFGASPEVALGKTTIFNGKEMFALDKTTSKLIYPLSTINSLRKTNPSGGDFNLNEWNRGFNDDKTVYGWFRFTGVIGNGHKILAFGDDDNDKYYITLSKSGTNNIFRLYVGQTMVRSLTVQSTTSLMFIGLRLFRNENINNSTSYVFTVNNVSGTGNISTTNYVERLTKFILGDRNIQLSSINNNPMLQEIAFISLGSYPYSNKKFQAIQKQEKMYNNIDIKPQTGVSCVNQKTYRDFEVMTLNGTFKSNKGRVPQEHDFLDGTYKIDKTKLFTFDHELKRHVYNSSSEELGLESSEGLLIYDHDLSNEGTIALNFKLNNNTGNKTIFEFKKSNTTVFRLYYSSQKTLDFEINDVPYTTSMQVVLSGWNRILLSFNNSIINMHLNNFRNKREVSFVLNLSGTKLIVGSRLLIDGKPSNHLEGKIEMLALKNTYLNNETSINNIVMNEQQMSVKTEIDSFGRNFKDIIDTGVTIDNNHTTKKLVNEYFYKDLSSSKTSFEIRQVINFDKKERTYEYDNVGNITKILVKDILTNTTKSYEYEYDKLSRIIKEYNPVINQTIKYTYGLNNNLQEVNYYNGKTGTISIKKDEYSYDVTYKDVLKSFPSNTQSNTILEGVDHLPTKILNKNLVWSNRNLVKIDTNTYTYNYDGIRTSKNVNNVVTNYHLLGDNVISLTKGSDKMLFHYNERNILVGFEYKDENYFYSRDIMGNINAIVDKQGNLMIEYEYDAWGNWLNKETSGITQIGKTLVNINPFIYKGYIFDQETNLYYLKSRYYSPILRRFISPDTLIGDVGNIENYNLYTYAMNNPLMYFDPNGKAAISIIIGLTVAGFFISGGINFGKQMIDNDFDFSQIDRGSLVNSLIVGAGVGFASGLGAAYFGPAIVSFLATGTVSTSLSVAAGNAFLVGAGVSAGAGVVGYYAEELMNGRSTNIRDATISGISGGIQGMLSFGISGLGRGIIPKNIDGIKVVGINEWNRRLLENIYGQGIKIMIDLIGKQLKAR